MKARLFIFILLCSLRLFGQNYTLKEAPIRDGYNTNLINGAPFIDKNRFVWYSTEKEGIFYVYDGKNKIKVSFFSDDVERKIDCYTCNSAWIQDNNGDIWVVQLGKVYIIKYNSPKFKVERIIIDNKNSSYMPSIAMDTLGNMWIGGGIGNLLRIDSTRKISSFTHPVLVQTKKSIKIFETLIEGRIFANSGYDIFLIDKKGLHYFGNLKSIDKKIEGNFQLVENGKIFKKNASGFYKYNGILFRYVYIKDLNIQVFNLPYNNNSTSEHTIFNDYILYDGSKLFIAQGKNLFINTIDENKNEITTIDTIAFKTAIGINFNKEHPNLIWISTRDKLYKMLISQNKFENILQFENKQLSTRGIVSDSKNNLYIGTYEGLYILGNRKKKPEEIIKTSFDAMILEKNDSILWASEYYALKKFNLNIRKTSYFSLPNRKGEANALKEKSQDEFWVALNTGLYVFNKLSGTISKYTDILPNNTCVNDILVAKNGVIWISTNNGLFFKNKTKGFINYNTINKNFNYTNIITLYSDGNDNLWLGTKGEGVIFLDLKKHIVKNYDTSQGLSNNIVCGILESKNAMWFSTYYGLSRFDKTQQSFTAFYKEDGLPDNEFNLRSVYKKNENSFYFGGLNGIIEFDPEKIDSNTKNPHNIFLEKSVYFSEAKNSNVTDYIYDDSKIINLPYNKNYFSATFIINELFYPESNIFYYKIDGVTTGWVEAGTSGKIDLYNLPSGDYVLEVKGKDFRGIETVNEKRIKLHVRQVFFKTPLFIIFSLILISSLIVYFFLRKTREQKRIFEREKEIIELKGSALKAQMNPHFIFNILSNLQSVLILKGEIEVNKYFGAFSKLLRLTLDMSKKELVSLKDELDYINSYLLLSNLQLNDELKYSITINDNVENTETIFIPGMLIQPFVENAIIHGLSPKKDKELIINCYMEDNYLFITIHDNGIGRAASTLLNANKKQTYKSWATVIVNDRIEIINDVDKESIFLTIEDITDKGVAAGTRVVLRFKIDG